MLEKEFVQKIAHALQEEEVDIYVLTLHYKNDIDLKYFSEEDQKRIKRILDILIKDTEHHAELLRLMVEVGDGRPHTTAA